MIDTQVAPGELTLVTGVPNSGKSEWLDALAVNLAAAYGWRFALCSLENDREGHLIKLIEKRCVGQWCGRRLSTPQFVTGGSGGHAQRMGALWQRPVIELIEKRWVAQGCCWRTSQKRGC